MKIAARVAEEQQRDMRCGRATAARPAPHGVEPMQHRASARRGSRSVPYDDEHVDLGSADPVALARARTSSRSRRNAPRGRSELLEQSSRVPQRGQRVLAGRAPPCVVGVVRVCAWSAMSDRVLERVPFSSGGSESARPLRALRARARERLDDECSSGLHRRIRLALEVEHDAMAQRRQSNGAAHRRRTPT